MAGALRCLSALTLAIGVAVGAGAAGPAGGAEPFEVMVLRGAGLVRVTGDASGALREEVLREHPHPARPGPESSHTPPEPVVIVVETAPSHAPAHPGWWIAHPPVLQRRLEAPGHPPRRGVVPAPRPARAPHVAAGALARPKPRR